MVSISDIKEWIDVIIVIIISFVAFENIIQPILVSIDPMFADQPAKVEGVTRYLNTPAEWSLLATAIVIMLIYMFMIKPYISDLFTNSSSR